jgi:hypothetical protein
MKVITDKTLAEKFRQAQTGSNVVSSNTTSPIAQERLNRQKLQEEIAIQEEAKRAAGILDETNIIERNLDVPGSIAGTALGMRYGKYLGPKGVVAGGLIGSFIGNFAGAYGSAKILNDPNVSAGEKAFYTGITGLGIDIATLSAGKYLAPLAKIFKTKENAVATEITTPNTPENFTAGTPESLRQTQELLLANDGAGLLPVQTGQASTTREVLTSIGAIGIGSKRKFTKHFDDNAAALSKEVNRQIDGVNSNLAVDSDTLGENIFNIIKLGENKLKENYSAGLDALTTKYDGIKLSPNKILKTIDDFVANKSDTLDDEAMKIITDLRRSLAGEQLSTQATKGTREISLKIPLKNIINREKMFSRQVDAAGNFKASGNTTSTAELAELASQVRKSFDDTLNTTSKNLAYDYQSLKSSYKQARERLLPPMSSQIMLSGGKDNYSKIGKSLLGKNTSEIKAYMNSIDEGFSQLRKAGNEPEGVIKTAGMAKSMIRQSYIRSLFGDTSGTFDVYTMASKMAKIDKNPEEQARLIALLGQEGFVSLKRLGNAIIESADSPKTNLFSLALRQKETNTLSALFAGGQGASAITGGPIAAAFVFGLPYAAAVAGTNRTVTNKLLGFNKKVERMYLAGEQPTAEFITSNLAKIYDNLSEEEKLVIKAELEDTNKP